MYDWKTFTFGPGAHDSRDKGMCIMEAVAYVAGEPHTDRPECACPVITSLATGLNDRIRSDDLRRELLAPYVFRIAGTRSPKHIAQRGLMCADWSVRVALPMALDAVGMHTEAAKFRAMDPIAGAAEAGWRAAAAAAEAKAGWRAAAAAAAEAGWRAAAEAGWRAAEAGWRAAEAGCSITPNVVGAADDVWRSAVELLERMIRLTEPQEVPPVAKPRREVACRNS